MDFVIFVNIIMDWVFLGVFNIKYKIGSVRVVIFIYYLGIKLYLVLFVFIICYYLLVCIGVVVVYFFFYVIIKNFE